MSKRRGKHQRKRLTGRKRKLDVPRKGGAEGKEKTRSLERKVPDPLHLMKQRAKVSGKDARFDELDRKRKEGEISESEFRTKFDEWRRDVKSDSRAEVDNALGHLACRGHISADQYRAGRALAELHSQLNRLLQIPRPVPKVSNPERVGGKDPEVEDEDKVSKRLAHLRAKYQDAMQVLDHCGSLPKTQVVRVAIDNKHPKWFRLDGKPKPSARYEKALKKGLQALAEHFHLLEKAA